MLPRKVFKICWFQWCLSIVFCITNSCKKLIQIPPPSTQISQQAVFSTDAGTMAAQSAIYAIMAYQDNNFNLTYYPAFSSDELLNYSTDPQIIQINTNTLRATNTDILANWRIAYNCIFQANAVIEGVASSTGISRPVRMQATGEAEFIRAYWYFYLTNWYGDVPLLLTSSYQDNASAARTPSKLVYQQIVTDLKDAQNRLNSQFVEKDGITANPSTERLRPTKWAAAALLARAYLYTGDWTDAEAEADTVLNASLFTLLKDLNTVFLTNSQEAIWQIEQTASTSYNVYDAIAMIPYITTNPPGNNNTNQGAFTKQLVSAFEPGDARMTNWVGSYAVSGQTYFYPLKYKSGFSATITEYEMVLRFAEQYLIRAEARAQQGKYPEAILDLNAIRSRAVLPGYSGPATNKDSILAAIIHERQVELFTEFGHRWLDLKRTGNVDTVMTLVAPTKGGPAWNTNQQLYPIPSSEILSDAKLTQNTGY